MTLTSTLCIRSIVAPAAPGRHIVFAAAAAAESARANKQTILGRGWLTRTTS
jgi:hypothetical protein